MSIDTTDHSLTRRPQWKALESHFEANRESTLRELFAADPQRGGTLSVEGAGLFFDFSKNRLTTETIGLLIELAEACGLRERTERMFSGAKINTTEDRAVLHTALRAPRDSVIEVDGVAKAPVAYADVVKAAPARVAPVAAADACAVLKAHAAANNATIAPADAGADRAPTYSQ